MSVVHGFERSVVTELCRFQQLLIYANFLLKGSSLVRKLGAAEASLLWKMETYRCMMNWYLRDHLSVGPYVHPYLRAWWVKFRIQALPVLAVNRMATQIF